MKRILDPKLKTWFDSRLLNPSPLPFTDPKDPVKMLILTGCSTQGISESGDNQGPMIELFQSTIGRAEKEAWCLGLIQSLVAYVEGFGFVSGLFPTEHCLTAWANSACMRPIVPQAGDITIYRFGETSKGHAALITSISEKSYRTLEGNTSPTADAIEREGDGVYLKTRPKGGIGEMKEMGFLRPFSVLQP